MPGPEAFGATDGRRGLLYGLVPLILGIHVAVPLLVNGVQGMLFSPDNERPGVWANFLGLVEAGIALALFYGGLTRVAALGLLWFFGLFLVGLESMMENVLYLGFATSFLLPGCGSLSINRLLFPRLESQHRCLPPASRRFVLESSHEHGRSLSRYRLILVQRYQEEQRCPRCDLSTHFGLFCAEQGISSLLPPRSSNHRL